MRHRTGIAGATLLFGPQDRPPDLVQAMQFLLDDLRGDGRRIAALKLTPATLRLRAEPFELVLTMADGALPVSALHGLLRPACGTAPDFARVHLGRALRLHSHAMGFLIRRRGAPLPDLDAALSLLAREGRFCLLPVIEAMPPSVVIWQPGALALTADEFRRAPPALLLEPGDASAPLTIPPPERLALARPGAPVPLPALHGAAPDSGEPSVNRADRPASQGAGRLFGRPRAARPPTLPGLERAHDRMAAALREPDPAASTGRRRAASIWSVLLPSLTGLGGLS